MVRRVSELSDLCDTLMAINHDVMSMAAALAGRTQRLGQAAGLAAAATSGAEANGALAREAVMSLNAASRAVGQAAELLNHSARVGASFVARTVAVSSAAAATPGGFGGGAPAAVAPLTDADRSALRDYTGAGFRDMNGALRGDRPMTPVIEDRAHAVSAALAKLPDFDGDVVRGATLDSSQLAPYERGAVVSEPAFTSSDKEVPFAGNTVFVLTSKHGKDVSEFSLLNGTENEVLFDRSTRFYVAEHEVRPDGKHYIRMEEM